MRRGSDALTNDGLFSDGYLEAAYSKPVDRPDDPEDERRAIVAEIADVWKRERSDAPTYDVADLEEAIVRPILRALDVPFVRDDRDPRPTGHDDDRRTPSATGFVRRRDGPARARGRRRGRAAVGTAVRLARVRR